jgi:hypothetical protein
MESVPAWPTPTEAFRYCFPGHVYIHGLLGDPIFAEELLFKPQHSIIDQTSRCLAAPISTRATTRQMVSGSADTAKALNDLTNP